MNHKLDNHPISERMIYVNDLQLANDMPYETERELEAAATGNREMEGGILPDDNVKICVPMDLNADAIMRQLYMLYDALGPVDEGNDNQAVVARHSMQGIKLEKRVVEYLEVNEGVAECFPYEEIEELKGKFVL